METLKKLKTLKWIHVILSVLLMSLGAAMLVYSEISTLAICYLAGVLFILLGIFKIMNYFIDKSYLSLFHLDFVFGVIAVIAGVALVLHPLDTLLLIPTVVGMYIILNSFFKLKAAIEAKWLALPWWWTILLLALVSAGLGVFLLLYPFTGVQFLIVFLGITLIVDGIENIWTVTQLHRLVKKEEPIEVSYRKSDKKTPADTG